MAKLRETSVQDSLTITSTDTSATKGLILSDVSGDNNSSVNFKNENGNLNISFPDSADVAPSLKIKNCDNITLPAGEININNSSIDISKTVETYTPNVTTKTVSMQDHNGPITVELVPENTSNSIFSSIGINKYFQRDSFYTSAINEVRSSVTYNWVLLVKDNNNEEKITFSVTLSAVNTAGQTRQVYDNFTIEEKNLSMHFRGPVTVQLISSNGENTDFREEEALKNIHISPTFNIRNYVQNNVLIGSVQESIDKSALYETVGIGNAVSPSDAYPLDIAAGGNHLKMDKDGALSFGKVIYKNMPISGVDLGYETGIYIINFIIYADDQMNLVGAKQYTSILCRFNIGGDALVGSYATDSGGYSLLCTSMGSIEIYKGSVIQDGIYINKIINIMSD